MAISKYSDLQGFKIKLTDWLFSLRENQQDFYSVFFSYGDKSIRCRVWNTADKNYDKVVKRTMNFIDKLYEKNNRLPEFLKFDFAKNIEERKWTDLVKEVSEQKHNNHYRKGIAFDENLSICFLEQEIYAKAIIRGVVYNEPNFFDEKNLNDAIRKKYTNVKANYSLNKIEKVWVFDTQAVFFENNQLIDLISTGPENGIRILKGNKKEHIKELVLNNAKFLHNEILESGRLVYGYFPAYNREIKSYNTVRHCTAIYALLETLEVNYNEAYLPKIRNAMQYAIDHLYKEVDGKAFMIDGNEPDLEIKLGSNAAAIFMFAKYQEIIGDSKYQKYAEMLAEGIRFMIDGKGETTHVLSFPSLAVKEKFRIVYYDGEAALGLLRLYQINQNSILLETVKLMFEHFITKKYDKYHDHWLSYCTNELTKICPEKKYFEFGLNNYLKHMEFIENRKTAYATFLEMMMSAYKMVVRLKEQGFTDLVNMAKFDKLKDLIELRVEFQRATGYFYPEIAMYMAKPEKILNAFYVRHDRFRTRIDDQEHNLSGYVAYLNYFI
ncbi:poly alpha-glucosyltransferase [Acinetobacter indicus]|uniref:poly alpha-glucosyltransferase n=1 Tax=Acinetobacter indicus TaxID=756892 RepID=UPI00209AB658|nr:poly alpha-glucosyltransferase [Acinetobacter indicus]MCO8101013.1 poly alpha-glucosyltransferase [Acinetobacter indicus]MCO8106633.1 poly alpha-glucosyltransferase [Acinetobacter indicus]MCO8112291.1 poly alpha-glucosyltransferase [Acinetobacter indicus]